MLAYILAIAVALGSVVFYIAAFFFPEIHRKNDFYWSFLGLFYALVLWVCSGRITGGVLLGQTASVVLLGWMGWQTLTLRQKTSPSEEQTEVSPEVTEKVKTFSAGKLFQPISNRFRKKQTEPTTTPSPDTTKTETTPLSSEAALQEIAESEAIVANPPVDITSSSIEEVTQENTITSEPTPESPAIPPEPPSPEMVAAAQPEQDSVVEIVEPEAELAPPAEESNLNQDLSEILEIIDNTDSDKDKEN